MLKVRSFPSSDAAAAMVQLRGLIGEHPGFAHVLACRGPYVLEEWVEGAVLEGREISPAQAQACGTLLAELHLTALPAHSPSRPQGSELAAESRARLHELAAAGALTTLESTRLAEGLLAQVPADVRQGLIHFDFCGENLVWAEGRGVVSIDNERLRMGPFAYDLGRTLALWQLPEQAQQAFLSGYLAAGGPAEDSNRAYWILVALITSAWFRVRHDPVRAELPLRALRAWGTPSAEAGR
jgi:Ser/Thr protein kinase RdoA (MazF antagonist)